MSQTGAPRIDPSLTSKPLKPLFTRIAATAEKKADWIAFSAVLIMASLSVVKSFYKPLWFDEILSVLMAK